MQGAWAAECCEGEAMRRDWGLGTEWAKGEKAVVAGFALYTFQNKNEITVFQRKLQWRQTFSPTPQGRKDWPDRKSVV